MFLGIDIHKREAQVAVRNDDGEVIEQVRVKNTDLEEIAQRYALSGCSSSISLLAGELGHRLCYNLLR